MANTNEVEQLNLQVGMDGANAQETLKLILGSLSGIQTKLLAIGKTPINIGGGYTQVTSELKIIQEVMGKMNAQLKTNSTTWNDVAGYAKEYGKDIANAEAKVESLNKSITRTKNLEKELNQQKEFNNKLSLKYDKDALANSMKAEADIIKAKNYNNNLSMKEQIAQQKIAETKKKATLDEQIATAKVAIARNAEASAMSTSLGRAQLKSKQMIAELAVLKKAEQTEENIARIQKLQNSISMQGANIRAARFQEADKLQKMNEREAAYNNVMSVHSAKRALGYTALFAGIGLVTTGFAKAIETIIVYDKALYQFQAVLDVTPAKAKVLEESLQLLSEKYGQNLTALNEVTLALGRAGIAYEDLAGGVKVVTQLAILTGDTIEASSGAVATFLQLFSKDDMGRAIYNVNDLGAKMAYMANSSKLSIADINTFINYAGAMTVSTGMTVDAMGALATAFSASGKAATSVGTNVRRLNELFGSTEPKVQEFFRSIGVNQANLQKDMLKGGATSEKAFKQFITTLGTFSRESLALSMNGLQTLDKDTIATVSNTSGEILKHLGKLGVATKAELDKADTITQSFETRMNSLLNTILGKFQEIQPVLGYLATGLETVIKNIGYIAGGVITILSIKSAMSLAGDSTGELTKKIGLAKLAVDALTLAFKSNPILLGVSTVILGVAGAMTYLSQTTEDATKAIYKLTDAQIANRKAEAIAEEMIALNERQNELLIEKSELQNSIFSNTGANKQHIRWLDEELKKIDDLKNKYKESEQAQIDAAKVQEKIKTKQVKTQFSTDTNESIKHQYEEAKRLLDNPDTKKTGQMIIDTLAKQIKEAGNSILPDTFNNTIWEAQAKGLDKLSGADYATGVNKLKASVLATQAEVLSTISQLGIQISNTTDAQQKAQLQSQLDGHQTKANELTDILKNVGSMGDTLNTIYVDKNKEVSKGGKLQDDLNRQQERATKLASKELDLQFKIQTYKARNNGFSISELELAKQIYEVELAKANEQEKQGLKAEAELTREKAKYEFSKEARKIALEEADLGNKIANAQAALNGKLVTGLDLAKQQQASAELKAQVLEKEGQLGDAQLVRLEAELNTRKAISDQISKDFANNALSRDIGFAEKGIRLDSTDKLDLDMLDKQAEIGMLIEKQALVEDINAAELEYRNLELEQLYQKIELEAQLREDRWTDLEATIGKVAELGDVYGKVANVMSSLTSLGKSQEVFTQKQIKLNKKLSYIKEEYGEDSIEYAEAENEAIMSKSQLAVSSQKAELDGWGNIAGAMSGAFKEGSDAALAFRAIQIGIATISAGQALITAWADPTIPAIAKAGYVATVAANVAQLLSMIGGSSGGGGSVSVPSVADTAQETLDFENTMVIDRLDRQIELLEQLNLQGSAEKLRNISAGIQFDYEQSSAKNTIRKKMEENLGAWQGKDQVSTFNSQLSDVGYKGDLIDYFMKDEPVKIWEDYANRTTGGMGAWFSQYMDVTQRQFEEMQNEFQQSIADFTGATVSSIQTLQSTNDKLKETFDEITESNKYAGIKLKDSFDRVDSLKGSLSFSEFLEKEIENIAKLDNELSDKNISLLLSQDIKDMRAQVELVNEISAKTGVVFENGAEDVLNYIDAIELVSETMISSRENMKSWNDSFKSDEELLQDLANTLNVRVATSVEELDALFNLLSNDTIGLTDAELELLEANKDYLISIGKMAEATSNAANNLKSFYDSFRSQPLLTSIKGSALDVSLPTSVEDYFEQFKQFRDDTLGLTDEEVDYLTDAKAYLEAKNAELLQAQKRSLELQRDDVQAQIDSYNELLSSVTKNISTMESIVSSLASAIDKLRGSAQGSEYTLNKYFKSMAETLSMAGTTDYEAYKESISKTLGYIDALSETGNFSDAASMRFQQLLAATQLEDIDVALNNELDYLRLIEINTRATTDALVLQLKGISTSITNSNTTVSDAFKDYFDKVVEPAKPVDSELMSLIKSIYTKYDMHKYQTDDSGYKHWESSVKSGNVSLANLDSSIQRAGTEYLVKKGYQEVVGRSPDTGGLNYWTNEVLSGKVAINNLNSTLARGSDSLDRPKAMAWAAKRKEGQGLLDFWYNNKIVGDYEANNLLDTYGILSTNYQDSTKKMYDYNKFKQMNSALITPFYSGGYTGDGGMYEPAGIVHRGEYVVNKATTSDLGLNKNNGGVFTEIVQELKAIKTENSNMKVLLVKLTADNSRMLNLERAKV